MKSCYTNRRGTQTSKKAYRLFIYKRIITIHRLNVGRSAGCCKEVLRQRRSCSWARFFFPQQMLHCIHRWRRFISPRGASRRWWWTGGSFFPGCWPPPSSSGEVELAGVTTNQKSGGGGGCSWREWDGLGQMRLKGIERPMVERGTGSGERGACGGGRRWRWSEDLAAGNGRETFFFLTRLEEETGSNGEREEEREYDLTANWLPCSPWSQSWIWSNLRPGFDRLLHAFLSSVSSCSNAMYLWGFPFQYPCIQGV